MDDFPLISAALANGTEIHHYDYDDDEWFQIGDEHLVDGDPVLRELNRAYLQWECIGRRHYRLIGFATPVDRNVNP